MISKAYIKIHLKVRMCIWLSDYSKEEMDKFVESMPSVAFKEIQKFYETMPKLRHEIEVENPKTKVKSKITLQGLTDLDSPFTRHA